MNGAMQGTGKFNSIYVSSESKVTYFNTIRRITIYLARANGKGFILKLDLSKGIEYFADTDFAGVYNEESLEDE